MKAYVYPDKSLERYAGRFVWLSVNTEEKANAEFLKRYPIPALPTLLVIDPMRDAVVLRYVGGATVPQLRGMLDDAEKRHRSRAEAAADKLLARADDQASRGQHADAVKTYEAALASAPRRWQHLGRAAESLLFGLSVTRESERCARRAVELYPRLKGTWSGASVAATGLSCAAALEETHAKRGSLLTTLEKATKEAFDDGRIEISDDDRSSLYIALIEAADATGDDERAVTLRADWAAFLEGAAARASTPMQRSVYDSHRLSAYLELETPEKAIPMLEQSERDFPDDYNAPARLALAYKEMKEYDKALAASDRALARVYGPRKLSVLSVRADIFAARGEEKAARDTIVEAIEHAKSLPEGQRSESRIKSLEKRLQSMP
jgi:tetratricopeptide (TPR) repeat protein